jgi:hypothetical protein
MNSSSEKETVQIITSIGIIDTFNILL